MYILAPLVFTLGASYLLYGQIDLWKKEVYELELKGAPKQVAEDAILLREGVTTKQIGPVKAEELFEGRYGQGSSKALQEIDESTNR